MRTVHAVLVGVLALYAYTGEGMAGKQGTGVSARVLYGVIILTCLDLSLAYYFRRTRLGQASESLRRNPDDEAAMKAWRFVMIITMVLVLSTGLYGFALRFLGASWPIAWSFYLVALILLLVWKPKLEVVPDVAGARLNQ